jgi:hypothetical protein
MDNLVLNVRLCMLSLAFFIVSSLLLGLGIAVGEIISWKFVAVLSFWILSFLCVDLFRCKIRAY